MNAITNVKLEPRKQHFEYGNSSNVSMKWEPSGGRRLRFSDWDFASGFSLVAGINAA